MPVNNLRNYLKTAQSDGKLTAREMESARYVGLNDDGKLDAQEKAALIAAIKAPGITVEKGADVFTKADQPKFVKNVTTFGGTSLPPAVKLLVDQAKANGAAVYSADDSKFNTYGVSAGAAQAKGSMSFRYTEITPEAIAADLALAQQPLTQMQIHGTQDPEEDTVDYIQSTSGRGAIVENYDHADHTGNLYARGSEGQKWSANFAVLEDGSLHCLPATRRLPNDGVILTNPDLARGKKLMFTGHLDMRDGKVVGVEMSGVISKLAGKGDAKFIDPVALLKAWGFDTSGVSTQFSNTSKGQPRIDPVTGLIVNTPKP